MELCAVHGLRYDSTKHLGCVMCRRGTTDEAIDEEVRERKAAIKIGSAGGMALLVFAAVGLLFTLSGTPEPKSPPSAAAASPDEPPDPNAAASAVEATDAVQQEKPAKELPPVLPVASLAGAKPTLVPRMQLERAKEACTELGAYAGGDYRCLVALTPLLSLLTQIPVSTVASASAARAYEVNRTGLGFDCLWFEAPELSEWKEPGRRDPKVYPYTALLVASPSAHEARVSLDLERKPTLVQAEGALWPENYAAYVTYDSLAVPSPKGRKASTKRYSACMTFPHDEPVTVYVGAAAWVGPGPADKRDGGAAFRMASVALLGVKGALAAESPE